MTTRKYPERPAVKRIGPGEIGEVVKLHLPDGSIFRCDECQEELMTRVAKNRYECNGCRTVYSTEEA